MEGLAAAASPLSALSAVPPRSIAILSKRVCSVGRRLNYLSRHPKCCRCLQIHASESSAVPEGALSDICSRKLKLEEVQVLDLQGNHVVLTDLWKDRRVVIGFTRHFGCVLCMKRANLLASHKEEIDAANTALVIIGPGKVEQACVFAKTTKFPGEVYADPNFSSHQAFEYVSGFGTTVSPQTGLRVLSAYLDGYRQDWKLSLDKDTMSKGGWQQGGILVAGPGKDNVLYLFKDKFAGDEPNMDDIVAACCKA